MTEPLEIERKFLIEMPERAVLDRCPMRWEIWQTYLLAPPGISARVRRRVGETEQFFHTEKLRRTDRTCVEREREITRAEYEMLLRQQDPDRVTIHKERYCLPEGGLVFVSLLAAAGRDGGGAAAGGPGIHRTPGAAGAAGGVRRLAAEKRRSGRPCAAGGGITGGNGGKRRFFLA